MTAILAVTEREYLEKASAEELIAIEKYTEMLSHHDWREASGNWPH